MNCCLTPLDAGRWRAPKLPWVLLLVIALPLSAVVAGLSTLFISMRHADHQLPAAYHWEGPDYESDQRALAAAAKAGLSLQFTRDAAAGRCTLILGGAAPDLILVHFTHPTDVALDRSLRMSGAGGRYSADCAALPSAHWWFDARDAGGTWLIRGRLHGDLSTGLQLDAQPPQ